MFNNSKIILDISINYLIFLKLNLFELIVITCNSGCIIQRWNRFHALLCKC